MSLFPVPSTALNLDNVNFDILYANEDHPKNVLKYLLAQHKEQAGETTMAIVDMNP